ncbi:MAG: competence type IV pilus major pilin ComGC [Phycisphaerales bacterium]
MWTRRRWCKPKAFTLIEILIVVVILGILAAIVIPQFTKASEDAQVGNVETQLQTIRSQIELYRVKNNGAYPALAMGGAAPDFGWTLLLGADYLKSPPVNPRTGTATIAAGDQATAEAAVVVPGDVGWLYDAATGGLFCNGFNFDFRTDGSLDPWP